MGRVAGLAPPLGPQTPTPGAAGPVGRGQGPQGSGLGLGSRPAPSWSTPTGTRASADVKRGTRVADTVILMRSTVY